MSAQDQEKLAADCERVAGLTAQAQDWVTDPANAGLVGPEARSLVQTMRRAARRSRRLARSARLVGQLRILRILISGLYASAKVMCWSFVLIFIVIFAFAVRGAELIAN